jgi:hypothetical protein
MNGATRVDGVEGMAPNRTHMKNKCLFIAIGTLLLAVLTASAQPSGAGAGEPTRTASQNSATKIERQLKLLTERLGLSCDQQSKIKPILLELQEALQKVMKDENLTPDERMENMRPLHERADQQIRRLLSDEQQKKLDQVESEPHPELHGE